MINLRIGLKQMISQLHSDLTGKDSVKGYLPTYTWSANQLGHYALGLSTFLLYHFIAILLFNFSDFQVWLFASLTWILFETWNTTYTLMSIKKSTSFRPKYSYILTDLSIDLSFFVFGTSFGYCTTIGASNALICFGAFVVVLLTPFFMWYSRIMYFQQGCYPTVYRRLTESGYNPDEIIRAQIEDFCKLQGSIKYIFITGDKGVGKSTLANAIASEYALNRGITRSFTFFQWIQELTYQSEYNPNKANQVWPWRSAAIMVIDDVEPSVENFNIVTPADLETAFNFGSYTEINLQAMQKNRGVWVFGASKNTDEWVEMFVHLKIISSKDEILSINIPAI